MDQKVPSLPVFDLKQGVGEIEKAAQDEPGRLYLHFPLGRVRDLRTLSREYRYPFMLARHQGVEPRRLVLETRPIPDRRDV